MSNYVHTKCAVLWDMDGVIVNTEDQHYAAWKRTLAEHGIELTADEFKRAFGLRNVETVTHFFGQDVTPEFIQQIGDKKEEYYREAILDRVAANPGAVRLIRSLKRIGFLQAIASSAPRQSVSQILDSLQITSLFDAVVTAEDVSAGKPDPQVFLTAARRLGVDPSRCVVIEDALAGVQAARDGGMKCIAVTTTNPAERLLEADLVVPSLESLTANKVHGLLPC